MRPQVFILILSAVCWVSAVSAEGKIFKSGAKQAILLELFTSQGCSSCPPAERFLNRYLESKQLWTEVVPVAFHVDYWDKLGWPDPFASARYSQRQRQYARSGNLGSVYTPGFLNNGGEWKGYYRGKGPGRAPATIAHLEGKLVDSTLTVSYKALEKVLAPPVELNVALLGIGIQTKVKRGENAARTLPQEFVVLKHSSKLSNDGKWSTGFAVPSDGKGIRYAIALWAAHPVSKKVLQATGGFL